MTIQDIYKLSIQKGIDADPRGRERVGKMMQRRKEKFEKLSVEQKEDFDKESLENPYSDTRILHIADDKDIKKVLVGIDIEAAEILLAKQLGDIDLVISHHPAGRALADLHEVMDLQVDVLGAHGVPVNVAEGLMQERISEVFRGINPRNNWRAVDAARLLEVNFMCMHTTADNQTAKFLKEHVEDKSPEFIEDIMKMLRDVGEYQRAITMGSGPKIFAGKSDNRCGKVLVGMTGGTEGSPKLYEKLGQAGIGTIVDMHVSEDHKKAAEASNMNVVITGHMSSDSIGMNLILDDVAKQGVEIVECSGFLRVAR